MPTCGECKLNVNGICNDVQPDSGKIWGFGVSKSDVACSSAGTSYNMDGYCGQGFTPHETKHEVIQKVGVTLGEILKQKIEASEKPTTCEDCTHFNGKGTRCGAAAPLGRLANNIESKCNRFTIKISEVAVTKSCGTCWNFQGDGNGCAKYATGPLRSHFGGGCPHHVKPVVQPQKEVKMSTNAIIRLADSQFNKDLETLGGLESLSPDLASALTDLQAKDRKEAATEAAREILDLVKVADASIANNVEYIREARRTEETAKKKIAEINRAKAYGLETNNFVPLAILTNRIDFYRVDEKLRTVPEGWKPKDKAAE